MKKVFILLFLLFIIILPSYSQCKCEVIHEEKRSESFQCQTLPIASDNSTQIGITVASNYEQHYLALTIRFRFSALDLISGLSIRLQNNKVVEFDLIKSGISYIDNSPIVQGVFALTENGARELGKSRIKTISFNLSDNITHIYEAKTNISVLINQIKCLPTLANTTISIAKSVNLDEKNGFQDFKLGMSIDNLSNLPIVKKNSIENNLLEYYYLDKPNLDILDNPIEYISFYCVDKIIIKIYLKVHSDKNNELYELLKETFGSAAQYKKVDEKVNDILSSSESTIKGQEAKWIGNKLTLQYNDIQSNSEISKVVGSPRNISLEYKVSNYDEILRGQKTKRIKKSSGKL